MKLQNKKTGMIGEAGYISTTDGTIIVNNINDQDEWYDYASLAELNEEWEDVPEEPKEWWGITAWGDVYEYSQSPLAIKQKQTIGNYFLTKEEAEKAVEKLKAWKRLKDKGFRFVGWDKALRRQEPCKSVVFCDFDDLIESEKDLDLLFGGEE